MDNINTVEYVDPNKPWGTKTLEVTLCQWGYMGIFRTEVGGNVLGAENLYSALEQIISDNWDNNFDQPQIKLSNGKDTLIIDDVEDGEDLMPLCVGFRIVHQEQRKYLDRP